jgi:hypothetical protein
VNHTLTYVPEGSIETYSGPEPAVGSGNSLNVDVLGMKTKTLSFANSVPQTSNWPENVVVVIPVGCAPAVGIAHSWKVPVVGSRWARLLVKYSRNQQQLPDGSSDKP